MRVESLLESHCDLLRIASFDRVALDDVDDFAILEEDDARRRGRVTRDQFTSTICGRSILSGEDRRRDVGDLVVLEGDHDARTRASCRTAANGIDNY